MIAFKAASVLAHGRTYNGTYLFNLGKLNVSSAYGSQTLELTRGQNVEAIAQAILAKLMAAWWSWLKPLSKQTIDGFGADCRARSLPNDHWRSRG